MTAHIKQGCFRPMIAAGIQGPDPQLGKTALRPLDFNGWLLSHTTPALSLLILGGN